MGTWSFLSCRPREAVEPQCVLSSQTRVTRQMCEKGTWSQLSATSARRARWGAAGTRGGRRTGRRTAAVRDTESRSGLIPLPEAAVSGVRKQGWNSSSPVLELCPYLPHCMAT